MGGGLPWGWWEVWVERGPGLPGMFSGCCCPSCDLPPTTCCLLPAGVPRLLPAPCRRNEPVRDSKGCLREDSAGATTRRAFTGLLGVGAAVAKQWWDRGLRWGCLAAACIMAGGARCQ